MCNVCNTCQYFFLLVYRASSDANIPILVLANLRWLDYIADYETLTTRIIEMIEGSPVKVWQHCNYCIYLRYATELLYLCWDDTEAQILFS